MLLTPEEVRALTGRKRHSAQARELTCMGIPYRRRTDGSCAVLRIHAETVEGFRSTVTLPGPQVRIIT